MSDPIRIQQPCHRRWDELTGEGIRRHCVDCSQTVVDLDALSDAEIAALRRQGGFCATYLGDERGAFRRSLPGPDAPAVTAPAPAPAPRPAPAPAPALGAAGGSAKAALAASVLASLLSACSEGGASPTPTQATPTTSASAPQLLPGSARTRLPEPRAGPKAPLAASRDGLASKHGEAQAGATERGPRVPAEERGRVREPKAEQLIGRKLDAETLDAEACESLRVLGYLE